MTLVIVEICDNMKRVTLSMDSSLLNTVDEQRGLVPRSRWICALLRDSLELAEPIGGMT